MAGSPELNMPWRLKLARSIARYSSHLALLQAMFVPPLFSNKSHTNGPPRFPLAGLPEIRDLGCIRRGRLPNGRAKLSQ